jgi:predicted MFS family arabinose efflux permease
VVTAALALLTISGRITIVEVLVVGGLVATIRSFDDPARYSLVPDLVPRDYLVSAVGLYSASSTGAQLLGPVLGGLLYLRLGIGGLFLVQAVTYLVLPAALLVIRPPRDAEAGGRLAEAAVAERPGPLRSIREGLGYIVRDPVILWVFVLCAASQFLVRPYTQLLPSFTEGVLHVGAVQLSWLLTASGVGALVGALVIGSLHGLERRGRFLILAGVGLGVALALLASQRALVGALGAVAVLGFMVLMFQGTVNTTLQLRAPDRLRGRVLSVLMMIPLGVMPLGISALGFVGSATGVGVSLGVAGVAFAAVALSGRALARDLWGWGDHRRRGEPSPAIPGDEV